MGLLGVLWKVLLRGNVFACQVRQCLTFWQNRVFQRNRLTAHFTHYLSKTITNVCLPTHHGKDFSGWSGRLGQDISEVVRSVPFVDVNENLPPAFSSLMNLVYRKNIKELMSQKESEGPGHQAEVVIPEDGGATAWCVPFIVHFFLPTDIWWRKIMRQISGETRKRCTVQSDHSYIIQQPRSSSI